MSWYQSKKNYVAPIPPTALARLGKPNRRYRQVGMDCGASTSLVLVLGLVWVFLVQRLAGLAPVDIWNTGRSSCRGFDVGHRVLLDGRRVGGFPGAGFLDGAARRRHVRYPR